MIFWPILLPAFILFEGDEATTAKLPEPLSAIAGDWRIVDTTANKITQDCDQAQKFRVTADGRQIELREEFNKEWSAVYTVVHTEPGRMLLILENEQRKTDTGDPVLWWAYFTDQNAFRWRRYDWQRDQVTASQWQRCD